MKKVVFIFGTRPEVVKLAPVILTLKKIKKFQTILVSTGQHDQLLKETLNAFGIKSDIDFEIMKHGQTLSYIIGEAVFKLDRYFNAVKPDLSVVLGDTSSGFAGALISFYHKIPIVHIEAGCRTGDIYQPFPEEINRRLIDNLTSWYFPATRRTKQNLVSEGHNKKRIFYTGSTESDAIDWILRNKSSQSLYKIIPNIKKMKQIVVITTHRRENWGKSMGEVFMAVKHIVEHHQGINFIYSVHPNPSILKTATKTLSGYNNLILIPHMAIIPFIHLIKKASLILSDSGGIQLQAGALKKPIIILRNVTEWPELIDYGIGLLVGTKKQVIISAFNDYVAKKWPKKIPDKPIYPKGATEKIVKIITSTILS